VPPHEYRENLSRIKDTFAARSIPVIFVTAPTAHYRFGVPDYLIDEGYVRDEGSAIALHRRYNEIVREVATGNRDSVVDLERELEDIPDADIESIFTSDGIHFTSEGAAVVARHIADVIELRVAEAQDAP
jgi:lysophospholipase L1-like esterase